MMGLSHPFDEKMFLDLCEDFADLNESKKVIREEDEGQCQREKSLEQLVC